MPLRNKPCINKINGRNSCDHGNQDVVHFNLAFSSACRGDDVTQNVSIYRNGEDAFYQLLSPDLHPVPDHLILEEN